MVEARKILLPLCLIGMGLAGSAVGDTPPATDAASGLESSAQILGIAEGALNYCGNKDPAAAERLQKLIEQLVSGASIEQLAQLRSSDVYRKAHDSVADFTAKVQPHEGRRFCSQALADHK